MQCEPSQGQAADPQQLEYDLLVAPGADPGQIRLSKVDGTATHAASRTLGFALASYDAERTLVSD